MGFVRDKRVKDALMNSTIQNMFARGELRKDHPLQRKPGRWNHNERSGLIATVLKDEDMDSIKVCEQLSDTGVILWVIDGLQRLTTLNSFLNNGFKIGNHIEFPVITYQTVKKDRSGRIIKDEYDAYIYENVEYDLRGKFYKDLPDELKEKFNNFKINIVKHLDCTDEEIGYHIRRYNKQKSMNASENAVTYLDHIAREVKKISLNNRFFKNDIYRERERNNGTIERIIVESVMCMFHLDQWQKQSKKMGEFLNQNSSKQEFDKLNDNLNRLEEVYRDSFTDVFSAKDSFIWFTLFHHFTGYGLADSRFGEFIEAFCDGLSDREVKGEKFSEIDKNKSTKDKSVIIKKLEILDSLMKEFFHIEDVEDASDHEREEVFISENVELDTRTVAENIELYKETLDELMIRSVCYGSRLLEKQNRRSLLAMVAYSYKADLDLDEWLVEYAGKNNRYLTDQKRNYLRMRRDFDKFCSGHRKKSA